MIISTVAITPPRTELFPTFFLAGFECSTHVNQRGERQDLVHATQHDRFVNQDYARLRQVGLMTVREGVPWYRVDRKGRYDLRPVAPFVEAGRRYGLTQIWDLFHYGFPTYLHPFADDFVSRFAEYCYAFARYLMRHTDETETRFYTPVNEPSFFAWAAGEVGWFAPFERGRGFDLKLRLAQAAIAGIDALRDADPGARIVNVDPVCHAATPLDAPELAEDAAQFNTFQWQTWDILTGKEWPELGGSPRHLDIVGVNYYLSSQWEHCRATTLAYDDPRRRPFRDMLMDVAERYPGHPIVLTETGGWGEMRQEWLGDIVDEVLAAADMGADLHGICLYPIIDMPDWHSGNWMQFGLWDLVPDDAARAARADGGDLRRVLHKPYLRELQRCQDCIESATSHPYARSVRTAAAAA